MTVAEVAAHLRVSTRTVWRLLAEGDLARVKVRGSVRVPETSVRRYVELATAA